MSHIYKIQLQGHLDSHWAVWFEPLTMSHEEDGTTVLMGPIPDQAALHGLLAKVRDLGIPLLAVVCVESGTSKGDIS